MPPSPEGEEAALDATTTLRRKSCSSFVLEFFSHLFRCTDRSSVLSFLRDERMQTKLGMSLSVSVSLSVSLSLSLSEWRKYNILVGRQLALNGVGCRLSMHALPKSSLPPTLPGNLQLTFGDCSLCTWSRFSPTPFPPRTNEKGLLVFTPPFICS